MDRHLPRKDEDQVWNQPTREKCVVVNKAEKSWKLEEHFDITHGDAGFGVCPAGFQSSFGSVFALYGPFPSFCNDNVCPVPLCVGSI